VSFPVFSFKSRQKHPFLPYLSVPRWFIIFSHFTLCKHPRSDHSLTHHDNLSGKKPIKILDFSQIASGGKKVFCLFFQHFLFSLLFVLGASTHSIWASSVEISGKNRTKFLLILSNNHHTIIQEEREVPPLRDAQTTLLITDVSRTLIPKTCQLIAWDTFAVDSHHFVSDELSETKVWDHAIGKQLQSLHNPSNASDKASLMKLIGGTFDNPIFLQQGMISFGKTHGRRMGLEAGTLYYDQTPTIHATVIKRKDQESVKKNSSIYLSYEAPQLKGSVQYQLVIHPEKNIAQIQGWIHIVNNTNLILSQCKLAWSCPAPHLYPCSKTPTMFDLLDKFFMESHCETTQSFLRQEIHLETIQSVVLGPVVSGEHKTFHATKALRIKRHEKILSTLERHAPAGDVAVYVQEKNSLTHKQSCPPRSLASWHLILNQDVLEGLSAIRKCMKVPPQSQSYQDHPNSKKILHCQLKIANNSNKPQRLWLDQPLEKNHTILKTSLKPHYLEKQKALWHIEIPPKDTFAITYDISLAKK
jgi:hypothetical protein